MILIYIAYLIAGLFTYYQKQNKYHGAFNLNEAQLDAYGYPTKRELAFTDSVKKLDKKNYDNFLEERKKVLQHKIITALYG